MKKIAVINNAKEARDTELYINGEFAMKLELKPMEMRWVDYTA